MLAILFLLILQKANAQKVISHYVNQVDSLKIGTGERNFL